MRQIEIEIVNESGLHARPASVLVKTASKFSSKIKIIKDGTEIDGKSILGVMSLAAEQGSKIILIADGDDEERALSTLITLVHNGFKEDK